MIRLSSIVLKKRGSAEAIRKILKAVQSPIAIEDDSGNILIGQYPSGQIVRKPVTLDGKNIGFVVEDQDEDIVADLIQILVDKEAEKKTLGKEVLDLYREINLIYNFSEKLAKTIDPIEVARIALQEVGQMIKSSGGEVYLLDDETNRYNRIANTGDNLGFNHENGSVDVSLIELSHSGKPEIINDVGEDKRLFQSHCTARSLIFAPLKIKDINKGLIILGNIAFSEYSAGELKLLNTLALQAASAIESALLYEKTIREAREREEALQRIDRLKDEFLANTSHELRTPLNGIIGIADALIDGISGPLPPKALENLYLIKASGKRLASLVNDILDFSKLKNKDISLQLRPVDLYSAVDVVLTLSRTFILDKELQLINRVPLDIDLVEADENRVQQILHNLVGNAIKFTEKGLVAVEAKKTGKQISVSVTDTGIGIPEEKFERIFQSFEQADGSTAREYGGTGLGLTVTKQLVELHNGTISVSSRTGEGSSFTFTLPVSKFKRRDLTDLEFARGSDELIQTAEPHKTEDVLKNGEIGILKGENKESSANILVVDDEPVNRQVLNNHLSLAGYQVDLASSGFEALKLIKSNAHGRFDLVILDIMMPRMSGYEVCQKLRDQFLPSELPIVLLTAKNRVADLVEGFKAGANDYLIKPFSKDELLSRVNTHLNLFRIHKATGRFIPHEFLRSVGRKTITDVQLGDYTQKDVTVFFTDIRDYTSMSENMTPKENFNFVNAFVGRIGPIIRENKGFINQYLGDGIMAIFPKKSTSALKAAIHMQIRVNEYNILRREKGRLPVKMGIGLHTGPLVMGIIGDSDRNDPATIADTVNIASRMEGLTKYFGARIILSGDTLKEIQDKRVFNLRYLGKVQVKGRSSTVDAYECFDGDHEADRNLKIENLKLYEEGINHFLKENFDHSMTIFKSIVKTHDADLVSKYFLNKASLYLNEGPPKDWMGVERLATK